MSEVSQPNLIETIEKLQEVFDVRLLDESETNELFSSVRDLLEELTESQSMLKYNQEMYDQVCESRKAVEADLEKVKVEREQFICVLPSEMAAIHAELSAKNKVLEWYGDERIYRQPKPFFKPLIEVDTGVNARTILSQYEVIPNETE